MGGAGDVQVGVASHWESRWRVGANLERNLAMNGYGRGGGRKEEANERSRQTVETGGAGGVL